MMATNRMSSLPIAEYCGHSPRLGQEHAAGMSALQSSCYHAKMAGKEWMPLYNSLPDKLQAELDDWPVPDFYADKSPLDELCLGKPSHMEIELGLDRNLDYANHDSSAGITWGTADMVWDPVPYNGKNIAIVGDAKRTRFTTLAYGGVNTLQLDAYGWAWAQLSGAHGYMAGIYILDEGRWQWRKEPVLLASMEGADIAGRIIHAAANEETVTGGHCNGCWESQFCNEYMLPAMEAMSAEYPETLEGLHALENGITHETAPDVLRLIDVAKNLIKIGVPRIKAFVAENGSVCSGSKEWRPIGGGNQKEYFDVKAMKESEPDIVAKYTKSALTSPSHRWVNRKSA